VSSRRHGTTEYRDVRAVNGKAVKGRGERAIELFRLAADADSLEDELAAIDAQTGRYEFKRHVVGFTVNPLHDDLRRGFQVELAGRDRIDGRDVIVLGYRQTGPPAAERERLLPALPREFGNARLISQGRLWIDATTWQLWRSVWELVAPHPDAPVPLVMVHAESRYTTSPFGILVPERIVLEWRDTFRHAKNRPPEFMLKQRDTFTYGAFREFETNARLVP
jgi:hypothetical protein